MSGSKRNPSETKRKSSETKRKSSEIMSRTNGNKRNISDNRWTTSETKHNYSGSKYKTNESKAKTNERKRRMRQSNNCVDEGQVMVATASIRGAGEDEENAYASLRAEDDLVIAAYRKITLSSYEGMQAKDAAGIGPSVALTVAHMHLACHVNTDTQVHRATRRLSGAHASGVLRADWRSFCNILFDMQPKFAAHSLRGRADDAIIHFLLSSIHAQASVLRRAISGSS